MIPKGAWFGLVCTAFLAWSGLSAADEYRPDEILGLDLSKAVLSPKPLGPASEFAPVAIEAKSDRNSESWWARHELKTEPRKVAVQKVAVQKARAVSVRMAAHPRGDKLARRHHNPLDAQASDTRIQVWPCKSGGICDWKRPAESR